MPNRERAAIENEVSNSKRKITILHIVSLMITSTRIDKETSKQFLHMKNKNQIFFLKTKHACNQTKYFSLFWFVFRKRKTKTPNERFG